MSSSNIHETIFRFGIDGLDEYYYGVLTPGTIITVAGHPGSGKTTFASQLCYSNATEGKKCLYISTQEPEEKFMKHMARLGFNFEVLLASDTFRFVRFPLISSEEALDSLLESITNLVVEFKPKIIVIDSVTPITKAIQSDIKRRAMLQNFFYNIAFDIKGAIVLVAEIPLGKEYIEEAGDVEFVADGIIILKHSIEYGLLSRRMEIRKLRGAPIEVSEVPFTIQAPEGIVVMMPPKSLKPKYYLKYFRTLCQELDEKIGPLRSGELVLIAGPPHRLLLGSIIKWALRVARESNAKLAIITYKGVEEEVKEITETFSKTLSLSSDNINVAILNAAILSPEALLSSEINIISKIKPDIIIHYGTETLRILYAKTYPGLFEKYKLIGKSLLRKYNVLTIEIQSITDISEVSADLNLADTVILLGENVKGLPEGKLIAYKAIEDKRYIDSLEKIEKCIPIS
ncbi:MAG: ATPase domain-containing protein [Acidilobaceae archaeon]